MLNFHLKVIKTNNSKIDRAAIVDGSGLLMTHAIEENKGQKFEKIQFWNLKPEKPSFAGMQINNLYDFFMLFVFMAGAASVVLFFLSKKLVTMMKAQD